MNVGGTSALPLANFPSGGGGRGSQARLLAHALCPYVRVCLLPPPYLPLTLLWVRVALLTAVLKLRRQRTA